ncbi:hypothetical protein EJV47_05790 [Hymenobacter gummosus]|uniref:Uncharacterized protein n=1 Tax=Hymenobacter gummosus TaxID=1776032 RepID=A0A431U7P8_9BACT|nr:hypothetical protein [Hymenobacter gummosus]RTQ52523.1 hypothetical protein EJV47_05790 [Hymenobacter gummosus]
MTGCQAGPSAAELRRLNLLDKELMLLNEQQAQSHRGMVRHLEIEVAKNRNQAKDIAVLEHGKTVRAQTQRLVDYLRDVRRQLVPAGELPTPEQLADRRAAAQILLTQGRADSLQRRLDRYVDFLTAGLGSDPRLLDQFSFRARRAHGGDQAAGASFGKYYFADASRAAALVELARQESEVLRLEAALLDKLSQQVGSIVDVFDKIGAFASAESNVVGEGETYRAELFLTASASGARPLMSLNGQPLAVGPDGKGRVAFTVPRLPPDQRRQTAYWDGTISVRYHGRDTTFRVRVPYTIVPRR